MKTTSLNQFNYLQVLVYEGPDSLPYLNSYMELGERSLLEILRRKLASDARDKLFGSLGTFPEKIRQGFRADYSRSVKEVYTEVVDYLIKTTERVGIICDAIYFPVHLGPAIYPRIFPSGHRPLK